MTFRGETVVLSVLRTPSASDMTRMKTVTTSAIPRTVIAVETFRTTRLRRLYLSGIPIRPPAAARPRSTPWRSGSPGRIRPGYRWRRTRRTREEIPVGDLDVVGEGRHGRMAHEGDQAAGDRHADGDPEESSEDGQDHRLRQDQGQDLPPPEAQGPDDGDLRDALPCAHGDGI